MYIQVNVPGNHEYSLGLSLHGFPWCTFPTNYEFTHFAYKNPKTYIPTNLFFKKNGNPIKLAPMNIHVIVSTIISNTILESV